VHVPAGELPQQPRVDGAEGQVGIGVDAALGQEPLELAGREVRVEDQARARPDEWEVPGLAQRVAPGGGAPVLPDDGAVPGARRRPVPGHDRLPLVGDAQGGHRLVELGHELVGDGDDRVPDLLGVVLHPAGPGKVLGELLVAVAERRARLVDGKGADPGGAGVDGDHHAHFRNLISAA
jgi:hypothetical protein